MKKILLILLLFSVILITTSCNIIYTAWVTVQNIGNYTITVIVDDDPETAEIIAPGNEYTYEIQWENDDMTSVYLYAYITNDPVSFDSQTLYLEPDDEQIWQVGWVDYYNKTSKVIVKNK